MFEFRDNESNDSAPPPPDPTDTSKTPKDTRPKDKDSDNDLPNVPSEVEIYLGKASEAPGTSTMEWHEPETKREHSSDEETTESTSKAKVATHCD